MTWSNEYVQVTRFRNQGSAKKHHAWKAAWSCSITSAGNAVCLIIVSDEMILLLLM